MWLASDTMVPTTNKHCHCPQLTCITSCALRQVVLISTPTFTYVLSQLRVAPFLIAAAS